MRRLAASLTQIVKNTRYVVAPLIDTLKWLMVSALLKRCLKLTKGNEKYFEGENASANIVNYYQMVPNRMTLQEFIDRFDVPSSIVLLEGKRDVLPGDADKLIAIGRTLAEKSQFIHFRSGNASGADEYFSLGVCAVNPKRLEVVIPYSGHRKSKNPAYSTISLDNLSLASEPEVVYQSRANKKTEKLIDQYLLGKRDRFAIKVAYILRDTIKVIGATDIPPTSFGLFYDDLSNPVQGGTGYTMRTCENNGVPFIDQRTWFKWIG